MNIETPSRVLPKRLISEPQSSDDDTMDSTYFSPDETVRCDEMRKLTSESAKSKSTIHKKTRRSRMTHSSTSDTSIRMDIDANGILRVDAEEARSGAIASFTLGSNQQSSTIT